jgi:AraC-like DNA-binding protein
MSIGQQILFFISALGAFNGILLSVYLLISRKRNVPAYLFLSILLLAISIRVAKSVFLYFNPQLPKIYLQIGLSACFLIGPAVYFFFKAVLEKAVQITNSWKWQWGILLGILLLMGIILPYQRYPGTWNNVIVYVIYLQWLVYLIATGFLLKNVLKAVIVNPTTLNNADRFRLLLFIGNCLIFLVYLLSLFNVIYGMYISGAVFFTAILYLTIFFHLKGVQFEHPGLSSKSERKKIADNNALLWITKLESMITSQALYKDPNLKLNDLAKHINISVHQLSQLLNENLGKSFSTYINEFRINEACKLITTNERLTFEAIGYEVGYNSKSTFYAAFRKIKNTTPALYKESTTNKI